jgi:hypothetical protein
MMTVSARASKQTRPASRANERAVVAARTDAEEEAALWAAIQANQEYKRQHPEEDLEIHETGVDFLQAVADL